MLWHAEDIDARAGDYQIATLAWSRLAVTDSTKPASSVVPSNVDVALVQPFDHSELMGKSIFNCYLSLPSFS